MLEAGSRRFLASCDAFRNIIHVHQSLSLPNMTSNSYYRRLEPYVYQCQDKCYSLVIHDGFAYRKSCPRIRSTYERECPKLCGEDGGPCMAKIQDVKLPCGHIKRVIFCHQMPNLNDIKCDVKVEKSVPKYIHTFQVGCFKDVTSPIFRCPKLYTDILSCGHNYSDCYGNCLEVVYDGRRVFKHPKCTKKI